MKFVWNVKKQVKKLFQVRPADESDYYIIGTWQIGKKLAFVLIVALLVCCICCIWLSKTRMAKDGLYPVYPYHSVFLRLKTGKVCILGKSGYQAYVGEIEKGTVSGTGTLYGKTGNVVYEGEFAANAYNGTGRRYYENTALWYSGEFKDNLFHGMGKLYRQEGTLKYQGEFQRGFMEGAGQLYDAGENLIYTGTFQKDRIKYQELLGKETEQLAQMYTGTKIIYQTDTESCVSMPQIEAAYWAVNEEDALEEAWTVAGVYVFQEQLNLDGKTAKNIPQISAILGKPIYEGNTNLQLKDAIALNETIRLHKGKEVLFGKVEMDTREIFDDVREVNNFDENYLAYLYLFQTEEITYTFFCPEKEGAFAFYLMQLTQE